MDYILLTLIILTWVTLGWHIKTTGDIYRAQATQTDKLIQIVMRDEVEVISPVEGQLKLVLFEEEPYCWRCAEYGDDPYENPVVCECGVCEDCEHAKDCPVIGAEEE